MLGRLHLTAMSLLHWLLVNQRELSAADLEQGNTDLQLNGSLGVGSGRWRLDVSSDPQISVMSYVLTSTGFLTNMSEVVGAASTTNTVWIFNPGSNSNQASKLRVINSGSSAALYQSQALMMREKLVRELISPLTFQVAQSKKSRLLNLRTVAQRKGLQVALVTVKVSGD